MTLETMDKEYVLHTYNRNYVNFTHGVNATLFDDTGRDYIDFGSGIGVASCGHGNLRVAKVIADQAAKITHISNLFLIEPQARLAKKLVELSGYDMRVFFANSGAEANEGAIKIARKYGEVDGEVKRYKIITLENSFHGRTITALKATGQEKMHTYFGPFPDGFVHAKNVDEIVSLIDSHTIAVMVELVQGEGGVTPLDKEKIQALAVELKKRDILLIIDEVQTGVYRTGELLTSQVYGIEPDVVTLAKGLGGGVPIGAIMTRLKDIFAAGDHGSTFGGNYLVTAAANEVLDILSTEYDSGSLGRMQLYFHDKLKKTAESHPELFVRELGVGMMRALELKEAGKLPDVIKKSFENGLIVLRAGSDRIRFLPPLTITKEEIDAGFERFELALAAL
jgi:acetylornithine aminotransferase